MDSWPYPPAHSLPYCPTSSHPPKSPPFRQPVSPRPTSRLPRAEDVNRMLVDCDDCFLAPPCCFGSPVASTSTLREPSTQTPLAFCCEEPSCLVSEQTCQGGAACPSSGFVGWDEMLAADGECEECEAGVELGTGAGCCESPFSPARTPFDSFNECCTEDCFGPVGQGVGASNGIELDCPDCWEVGGGVGGSGTTAMAALSMVKDEELTETNSSVATPADASPNQGFGTLLQIMDEKALQDILDCCCCGPDISQTHTFDPSHHPYAHQHYLEPIPAALSATPQLHVFHPSLLPPPISFPCKWSDCNLFFPTKDALAIHVNGDHLAAFVAPSLPMYGPSLIDPAKCLWDSCETPAWVTPLPVPFLPITAAPVDDKVKEATSNLLQHLLNDHLAKLEPGVASAISASLASHSPHLLSHPLSTPSSTPDPPAPAHQPAHAHSHPHPHPHPHAHPHRHRHAAHPYGVHSRAPSTTPSLTSVPGSHPCLWTACSLVFGSTSELMTHLSADHVGSGKASYVCEWDGCERRGDKGFAQRQKVMRHLQTHTGDRPFVCETCGKSFSEATTLTQHIRVHTNERPYKCTYEGCEKAFALASALTIHSRIHTGDKPFLCPHPGCTSAFSESSNLSKHIRTHKGEKGYACDECGKAFSRSDQLARHKKIHARARGEEVS